MNLCRERLRFHFKDGSQKVVGGFLLISEGIRVGRVEDNTVIPTVSILDHFRCRALDVSDLRVKLHRNSIPGSWPKVVQACTCHLVAIPVDAVPLLQNVSLLPKWCSIPHRPTPVDFCFPTMSPKIFPENYESSSQEQYGKCTGFSQQAHSTEKNREHVMILTVSLCKSPNNCANLMGPV